MREKIDTPWFTDNVFWNDVVGSPNGILTIQEFIELAEEKYEVASWRLIPNWNWKLKRKTPPLKVKHK